MSFTANPYRHIGIVQRAPGNDGEWAIECSSCGGYIGYFNESTPIAAIKQYNQAHIMNSHKRTEADFTDWS